jgi:hypothetical protein
MRVALLALGAILVTSDALAQKPAIHRAPAPPPKPAAPLPSLPSIARVRVEAARDHVIVLEEVDLPRGAWTSGDLDLYVAFAAPGAPVAFDAHLLAVPDGALAPLESDAGEPIAIERAPRRPVSAQSLLGPPQMAGAVLHVKEPAFRRAVAPGNMAAIRVRTLAPLPEEDARTGREIVVRLGAAFGTPLTLGRVQIASIDPRPFVTRAEAHLCGLEADPYPLAIALTPKPSGASPQASTSVASPSPSVAPIAPVLAVRHASDDLCIRFWAQN